MTHKKQTHRKQLGTCTAKGHTTAISSSSTRDHVNSVMCDASASGFWKLKGVQKNRLISFFKYLVYIGDVVSFSPQALKMATQGTALLANFNMSVSVMMGVLKWQQSQ